MATAAPRQALSRALILNSAVRLLDRQGLDALSMRKLGEELGVEAMSLYRHVASKQDLLDGVHESILRELPAMTLGGQWRQDLATVARAFRYILLRHPRALPLFATRPVLTPGSLPFAELLLALFREAGFDGAQALAALQLFHHVVVGHCAVVASQEPASGEDNKKTATAQPETRSDLHSLAAEEFPHAAAALQSAGSAEAQFEFALQVLLAGLDGTRSQGVAELLRELS